MSEFTAADHVGLCRDCNYALRGLPENRCPDCGRVFDPDDPDTMNMGRAMGRRVRSLLRLPTTRWIAVTIVASIAMLVAFVPPGSYVLLISPLLLVWIVVGLRWFFGCSLFYLIAWHFRQPHLHSLRALGRSAIIPIVTLATLLLLAIDAPLRLHFWAIRPSLERLVQEATRGELAAGDRWVGLMKVGQIQEHTGEVRFTVRGTMLILGQSGLVYHPQGRPKDGIDISYSRLWGDWYVWILTY